MSAPLAHLHALAQRTLDAHERRAGDLRTRLAPVLAAGAAATALLTPQALTAVRSGGFLCAATFLLTVATGFATVFAIGRFLNQRPNIDELRPRRIQQLLVERDALDQEPRFHDEMILLLSAACETAAAELDTLHHQFTAIMCGILFVLCGLALTAVVAW